MPTAKHVTPRVAIATESIMVNYPAATTTMPIRSPDIRSSIRELDLIRQTLALGFR